MPDVLLFLKSSIASVSVSAVTVLTLTFLVGRRQHKIVDCSRGSLIMLFGFLIGALTGYVILGFGWTWPPSNALNRFLELILPAVLLTELLAYTRRIPFLAVLFLRGTIAAGAERTLLHGSVYLPADSWVKLDKVVLLMLIVSALSLMMVWRLLIGLAETRFAGLVSLSLAMSLQAGGAAIMLAGYIKGGAAAIPLASALAATGLIVLMTRTPPDSRGLTGVALVSLYSVIIIGCYFGALTSVHGILVFFSPCLCVVSRLPWLRSLGTRGMSLVCLSLVSLPLLIVLIQSVIAFRDRMAPLISDQPVSFRFVVFEDA